MKLTKFVLNGDTAIDLPVVGASVTDRFKVTSITGLGPPDSTANIGDTIYSAGNYQGSQPVLRQIVATIGLNPDYSSNETVEELREELYGMVDTDFPVMDFEIWNGVSKVCFIGGSISKFEVVPFSKDPEVQITIDCLDAYFVGDQQNVNLAGMNKSIMSVFNIGSVRTGFQLNITLTANLSLFKISRDIATNLEIDYAFLSGDMITFDTRDGNRSVSRVRSGASLSLIDNMTANSEWFPLLRGGNLITMSSTSFNYTSMLYTPRYLGV